MDGILVLAKPAGPTSHDMVALVRRIASTRRVGHGGTLDPFAAGVLPLFLGAATRVAEYHLGDDKAYRATVCFGATSTTDDLDGELTPVDGPAPDRTAVEAALASFRGQIEQRPPAYSAIKVAGRRAYAMARAGETPELPPRRVTIHALDLVEWDDTDPDRPIAVLDVRCSAGTYVRALARDVGAALGTGAYLGALLRTASGPFRLGDALEVETVREAAARGREEVERLLLPVDWGLHSFPSVTLGPADRAAVARGQFVRPPGPLPPEGTPIRLLDTDGRLVAIATRRANRLAPDKVLVRAPGAADRREPPIDLDADAAAERDPSPSVDPDPASPDDV
jgi:tRNA pseudouridine55 synthase